MQWSLKEAVKARLKDLELGPVEAATRAGLERTFIRDITTGKKLSVQGANLLKLAEALETTKMWLLEGTGPKELDQPATTLIPIIGRVGLGHEIIWLEEDDMRLGEAELPFSLQDRNCLAIECIGDSMKPRYQSGEIVIVKEIYINPENFIGQEAVVKIKDGPFLLKTIKRGYTKGKFNLESYNADTREDQEIERIFEIWMIIKPSKIHKICARS